MKYTCKGNERLDQICFRYYGQLGHSVEAVLSANPGLAEHDLLIPAGTSIELPELPDPSKVQSAISLWS